MNPDAWESEMSSLLTPHLDKQMVTIKVGSEELTVEVAATAESRQQGLGLREEMPGDGMLFICPPGSEAPFSRASMKMDITIWFFDSTGELVDVNTDGGIARASNKYTYVLETSPELNLYGRLSIKDFASS